MAGDLYVKQIFNPYDKSLSIEENIKNNGIITAEDMNRHEEGIHSAHEAIKDKMDKKFSSEFCGKLVGVGEDGFAVPVSIPGPPTLDEDGTLNFGQFAIAGGLTEDGTLIP